MLKQCPKMSKPGAAAGWPKGKGNRQRRGGGGRVAGPPRLSVRQKADLDGMCKGGGACRNPRHRTATVGLTRTGSGIVAAHRRAAAGRQRQPGVPGWLRAVQRNRMGVASIPRRRGLRRGSAKCNEPSPTRPRPRESPPLGGVPKGSQGGISRPCAVSWGEHNEHYVQ